MEAWRYLLVGILFAGCRKLPHQHIVDDGLLPFAQTALVGKKMLDVGTRIAADELVIVKGKVPACQITRGIMADAAFLLIQAVGLDLPLERLHEYADFVIVEIAEVVG